MVDINSQEFWEDLRQRFKEDPAKCLSYCDELIDTPPKDSPELGAFFSKYLAFIFHEISLTLDFSRQQAIVSRLNTPFQDLLIQEYLETVAYIKNQGKKLKKEEKLIRLISPLLWWRKIELGELSYPFTGIMGLEGVNLEKELDFGKLHYDQEQYEIDFGDDPLLGDMGVGGSTRICFWDKTKELKAKAKEPPSEEEEKRAKERQSNLSRGIQKIRQQIQLEYAQKKTIPMKLLDTLIERERDLKKAQNWRQIRQKRLARAIVEVSLEEYFYDEWLPNLTAETMKSKDLLDQICVIYAIKRAQNGDEKAIEKLFNLYESKAEALAVKFAQTRGLMIPGGKDPALEVKNRTLPILHNLIRGDTSQALIDWLTTPNTADSFLDIQTRKAKDIFLEYLLNYLPEELNKILDECNQDDEIKKLARMGQKIRPDLSDDWVEHIMWANRQLEVEGLKITALLDPFALITKDTSFLKKAEKGDLEKTWDYVFNNYSFRPERGKNNLTTWLFGTERWPQYGKVWQRLRDYYEREQMRERKGKKPSGSITWESVTVKGKGKPTKPIEAYGNVELAEVEDRIEIEQRCKFLRRQDISGRDIEIYRLKEHEGYFYPELAEKFELTERRIKQIMKKLRALLPKE